MFYRPVGATCLVNKLIAFSSPLRGFLIATRHLFSTNGDAPTGLNGFFYFVLLKPRRGDMIIEKKNMSI